MALAPYNRDPPAPRRRETREFLLPGTALLLGYGAFAMGGFYWKQAAILAAGFLGLALALVWRRAGVRGLARGFIAAALLAVGMLASWAANGTPTAARAPFAALAVAVGALTVAHTLVRDGKRRQLFEVIVWIGAATSVGGLVALSFHWTPWAMRAQGIWRLASTLTYANSAGALLVLTLPAALLLLWQRPTPVGRVGLFLLLTGVLASMSRGAIVAGVVMAIVLVAFGAGGVLRSAVRPFVAALLSAVSFIPTAASDGARPGYAFVGLLVGAIIAALPFRSGIRQMPVRAGATALLAASLLVLPALFTIQHGDRLVAKRIGLRSEDRLAIWKTAWRSALKEPIFGTGPGTFEAIHSIRGEAFLIRYAHNEFLQAFAETGVVGIISIGAALAVLSGWLARTRHVGRVDERTIWVVAVAACVGFMTHSIFDFIWRLPAVVALAFVWLAVAVTRPLAADESMRA